MPCLNLIRERKIEENKDHGSSLLILYGLTEIDSFNGWAIFKCNADYLSINVPSSLLLRGN